MSTGQVYTDLFFDLEMGQTRKNFYDRCWDLNAQKMISQGPGNNYARYLIPVTDGKDTSNIEMLFYGIFDTQDIMRGMDMKFSYTSYAPWNEIRHSDQLLEALKEKYMKDYPGNEFIKIDLDLEYGEAVVKVDGNRQIVMYPLSQKDVAVKIEDLRYKDTSG